MSGSPSLADSTPCLRYDETVGGWNKLNCVP
jgi:hypothetical protein